MMVRGSAALVKIMRGVDAGKMRLTRIITGEFDILSDNGNSTNS